MRTHLNYWAVLLAALSAFVVGGIWYKVFAGPWKKARDYASYGTSLLVGCTSWFADFRCWLRSGESASGTS
jgi:hypothetical protein